MGYGLMVMCSGSEAGSYLRLIDLLYHSTPGLRAIQKREKEGAGFGVRSPCRKADQKLSFERQSQDAAGVFSAPHPSEEGTTSKG